MVPAAEDCADTIVLPPAILGRWRPCSSQSTVWKLRWRRSRGGAGVGIRTLYRHFPSREHLVEVVYGPEVELLCAAADELGERERPDIALEQWMHRLVGYIAT
jgi:hypothetical protein